MPGPYITKEELAEILMNLDDRLGAIKALAFKSDTLSSDFTTTTTGSFQETGLEIVYTPAMNSRFIPTTRILAKVSNGGKLYVGIFGGENDVASYIQQMPSGVYHTFTPSGYIDLNADTAYTLKVKVMFDTAGTLTILKTSEYTKFEGYFVTR